MSIKTFEAVQIGDIAIDYALDKSEVYDKGTLIEMLNKHYMRLPMGLTDYVSEGISFTDNCIVLKETPTMWGDLTLYIYGTYGAYVEDPTAPVLEDEYDNFHPIDNI